MSSEINRALEKWTRLLDSKRVQVDSETLAKYEASTLRLPHENGVRAVLKPSRVEDVQDCVRIAGEHRIPIYPISRGMNWGYGSRSPMKAGCVILDLGGLDQIVEINEEFGYAVVQPGVTQEQLSLALKSTTDGRLWMDATGASPRSSILGNVLERGHGLTPYGDHAAESCRYDVILASGERLKIGGGMFANSRTQHIDQLGLGPSLDGLFLQSNFGIVVEMTIWLMKRPEAYGVLSLGANGSKNFQGVVDAIRELCLSRSGFGVPHFGNHLFALTRMISYPWEEMNGRTPLSRELGVALALQHGANEWNSTCGIYGTEKSVTLQAERALEVLRPYCASAKFLRPVDAESTTLSPQKRRDLSAVFRHLGGETAGTGIRRLYWRKKSGPPEDLVMADPDRDRCGVVAVAMSLPFRGDDVVELTDLVVREHERAGFEANTSMVGVKERTLQMHSFICYDRDVDGDDEKALECERRIREICSERGLYPHRAGVNSMATMKLADPVYMALLRTLKKALDPNGILAPGRYDV